MIPNQKTKAGYTEAIVSTIANFFLFAIKLYAGITTASFAIIADAWHTLSDSISSVAVYVGFKISSRPPDSKHPFGHGRMEVIISIFVAVFLGVIGFEFLKKSVTGFFSHRAVVYSQFAIAVTIISILIKELLAQLAFYLSKKADSLLLKADGWHHRSDAISSVIILAGIFLNKYFWWMDSFLTLVVSLLIFYVAYDILNKSISNLLGERPSSDLEEELKSLICKEEKLKFHHFHLHDYGSHKEITFHIKINPEKSVRDAHKIADCIEKKIKEKYGFETTIHIEPDE